MKPTCLIALMALAPILARADQLDFVTVSATASKAYLAARSAGGGLKPQTYIFYQGKFFANGTRDPSIDQMKFLGLANALAPNLAQQNYHPAADAKSADLLIVVNWGTTLEDYDSNLSNTETQLAYRDLNDAIQGDSGGPMVSGAVAFAGQQARTSAISSASAEDQNAHLLGYDAQLAKDHQRASGLPTMAADEETHRAALIEERYFVILLAYDYQDILRNHAKGAAAGGKPAPPSPVWQVRMNVQANGNNFTEALPAMARVAANYFGKSVDGIATEQTDMTRDAHVEVGQPKVVGVVK